MVPSLAEIQEAQSSSILSFREAVLLHNTFDQFE